METGIRLLVGMILVGWARLSGLADECSTPTFQEARLFYAGTNPTLVAAGDFNGDGKADLIVGLSPADPKAGLSVEGSIAVLVGNGDATFKEVVSYRVGIHPVSIVVGDFNGDGKPDLAVANEGAHVDAIQPYISSSISLLLGRGDGTFEAAVQTALEQPPLSLAVADVNSDGKLDLILISSYYASTLSILLGKGDGTFEGAVGVQAGESPFRVVAGDFNGDGAVDLAVANNVGTSVLLGNGKGSFQKAGNYHGLVLGVGDLNRDGKLDLVAVGLGGISVLLGKGDGSFQAAAPSGGAVTFPWSSAWPLAPVVSDFNGDGRPDLAVAEGDGIRGGALSIMLGRGDGTFRSVALDSSAFNRQSVSVAVADFNGDGQPDLVYADGSPNVSVLLNTGAPSTSGTTFTEFSSSSALAAFSQPATLGDFNGDGKLDLIIETSSGASVLIGNGDGTFQNAVPYQSGVPPVSGGIGDLNGDGIADSVGVGDDGILVSLGNADGTFTKVGAYLGTYLTGAGSGFSGSAALITTGDLNGDGKPDLIVGVGRGVTVLLGNGDGTFQTPFHFGAVGNVYSVAVGDCNGDGKPDIITVSDPNLMFYVPTVFLNTSCSFGPSLTIRHSVQSAALLTLVWPFPSTAYILESSSSLEPGSWKAVDITPAKGIQTWEAAPPTNGSQAYFRLYKP